MMTDIVHIGFSVNTGQIEKGYQRLNKMGDAAEKAEKKTSGALGSIGKSAGQAGIQIQQFVGQVQMGTSPLVALSQQAADLGIVLGAPLIGAITGIAASIGTVFLPSLFSAEDATEKLKKTLEAIDKVAVQTAGGTFTLSEEIARLARVSETAANAQIALSITEATQAINLARESADDAIESLDDLLNGFDVVSTPDMIDKLNKAMERTGLSASELIKSSNLYATGLTQLRSFSDSLGDSLGTTTEDSIKLIKAVSEFRGGGSVSDLADTFSNISLSTNGATKEFQSLAVKLNNLALTTEKSEAVLDLLKSTIGDLDSILGSSESIVNEIIDSYKMKTEALASDEVQMAKNIALQAISAESTQEEKDAVLLAVDAYYKKLNAIRDEQEAQRKANKERERAVKLAEKEAELAFQDLISGTDTVDLFALNQAKEYDKWIESISTTSTKIADLRAEIEKTQAAVSAGDIRSDVGQEYINDLQAQLKSLEVNPFKSMTEGAQDALSAMSGMFESGSKDAQKLAIAMQALNLVQAVGAVLNQGKGDPYTAFGRMATMAAMVASLGVSIGSLSGGFDDVAGKAQEQQGLDTWGNKSDSIADATEITANATKKLVGINTDMLEALQNLGTALASAAGIVIRGNETPQINRDKLTFDYSDIQNIFEPLGIEKLIMDPLGLFGKTINKLFGGSSKVVNEGIRIVGGSLTDLIDDVLVQSFQTVQYKKWKFGSNKSKTQFANLGEDVSAQVSLVLGSIAESVSAGASQLGIAATDIESRINAFTLATTDISLMGLSAEEQQKEIQAVFSKIFDNLASDVVPFIDEFQKVGESLGETLARVATQTSIAEVMIERFGVVFGDKMAEPQAFAQAADNISNLVGGVDKLAELTSSFTDAFATDQQKFDIYQSSLLEQLSEIGLSLPSTTSGFYDLMKGLDATTESGQEQIAALLGLTDTASSYYSLLEKMTDKYRDAASAMYKMDDATRRISIDSALAAARMGDFSLADNLNLSGISPSMSDFSSAFEYNLARAETAAKLNELADLQSGQVTVQDKQLSVLEQIRDKIAGSDNGVKDAIQSLENKMTKLQNDANNYLLTIEQASKARLA